MLVNALQQFRVLTQEAGYRPSDLQVAIATPTNQRGKYQVTPNHEGFHVCFTPLEIGDYFIDLMVDGMPLPTFPRRIVCLPRSEPKRVRAHGPGLVTGIVDRPADFVIDTRGAGQGGLGVTVEGPCEAAITCRDNGDGTCAVSYLPTEPGDYVINITFNDEHISGSPFEAFVDEFMVDVSRVRVLGAGVQPHGQHQLCSSTACCAQASFSLFHRFSIVDYI